MAGPNNSPFGWIAERNENMDLEMTNIFTSLLKLQESGGSKSLESAQDVNKS